MIYLDHAATTPLPRPVADAMYQVLTEEFGNPSAQYALGRAMDRKGANRSWGASSPTRVMGPQVAVTNSVRQQA